MPPLPCKHPVCFGIGGVCFSRTDTFHCSKFLFFKLFSEKFQIIEISTFPLHNYKCFPVMHKECEFISRLTRYNFSHFVVFYPLFLRYLQNYLLTFFYFII